MEARYLSSLGTGLLLLVLASAANAILIIDNGSFESGDLTGWIAINEGGPNPGPLDGSVLVVMAATAVDRTTYGPTDGNFFADLQATSYLIQNLSWSEGEQFSFDWAFSAADFLPYNDTSILQILDSNGGELESITLADVASVGNFGNTGDWQTYTYTFGSTQLGSIKFGSLNSPNDQFNDSHLLVDNVRTVPEPTTLALLGIGLALTAMGFRNRKSKRKFSA